MKHILIIDPLEKLNIEKDSTIQLAITMRNRGLEVFTIEENQIWLSSKSRPLWQVNSFEGNLKPDQAYIEDF